MLLERISKRFPARMIGGGLRKGRQYLRELGLCNDLGADGPSRLGLALATLGFHVLNGLRLHPNASGRSARAYRIRWGGRECELHLRTTGGDLFVFHEIFLERCYEIPPELRGEIRSVVDLGAHIGLTTFYLSDLLPRARFVCVEPDPFNAALLRKNVAALSERVLVLEGAVGGRSGTARFAASGHSWGGRLGSSGALEVRCYSMHEILSLAGMKKIDLLKVDIEGGEDSLFTMAAEWLDHVRAIVLEIHEPYSIRRLEKDLGPRGFKVLPPDPARGRRMVMAFRG